MQQQHQNDQGRRTPPEPYTGQITPMMQQYLSIKASHPDYLVFYRMGDFYELFFEDATIAADVLKISLTKRGKHQGEEVPMCGVPSHAYDHYLEKLIRAGFKVAICEQMESPEDAKKRGYKEIVRRDIVRIITPGTILEDSILDSRQSNYLCSIAAVEGEVAMAWVDITTGEFNVSTTSAACIAADLARLSPSEIILPDKLYRGEKMQQVLQEYHKNVSVRANNIFDLTRCEDRLKQFFNLTVLSGLSNYTKAEVVCAGAVLEYLEHTQKSSLPKLSQPKKISSTHFMFIDSSTRKNLELEKDTRGNRKNSLLQVIDKTLTASGARLLAAYLAAPLCDQESINRRLDNVECFVKQPALREKVRSILKAYPDSQRAISRVYSMRGGPRDLGVIRDSMEVAMIIAETMTFSSTSLSAELSQQLGYLGNFGNLLETLKKALRTELPLDVKDGNFVRPGYSPQLDELMEIRHNVSAKLAKLKEKYQDYTSIPTLKIASNNMIGYYIEVGSAHAKKMQDSMFIHRQTLGSAVRYTTDELRQLENDIMLSDERIARAEQRIFSECREFVLSHSDHIALLSQAIAAIDVSSSLAELAVQMGYTRPIIDNTLTFEITQGRHPVVEYNLKSQFVCNDCTLVDSRHIWLITGPNMAGKSTFLRQNALIAIMAQIGSFVPASSAHIGVIDKLFSRIGAGDDISRGQSTFLVEMVETASILNNATSNSFVILDELGRGTSTYDGLSIAWSVIENIHNSIGCRTLFATHYHELTELEKQLSNLECYTMKVAEWEGSVVFMHEVVRGKADRSYGIHVAKLAGVPASVIARANSILTHLQEHGTAGGVLPLIE